MQGASVAVAAAFGDVFDGDIGVTREQVGGEADTVSVEELRRGFAIVLSEAVDQMIGAHSGVPRQFFHTEVRILKVFP